MLIGVLIGRYELSNHITTDTFVADRTVEWTRLDYVVCLWIYGSVSKDILDIIMAENQTAFEAYALIRNLSSTTSSPALSTSRRSSAPSSRVTSPSPCSATASSPSLMPSAMLGSP
jgi:hypothetical protein